ncbi:hypothetical protein ACN27G_07675 [Plantactinospora sp. WMMB334]|uniref:hypothetical protein n=1 Tax=Plantactinospora sp. WMMB334 TaxID=3404119 RepID=UPI003B922273
MHTYRTALAMVGASVPDHLVADAEVPILSGPQAQGDLMVIPLHDLEPGLSWRPVPADGIQVVRGEATGNTHWLHRGFDSAGVRFAPASRPGLTIGYLEVPAGQSAQLIHTDEHGANGIGPGRYRINRKRELTPDAPRIRLVVD